VTYSGLGSSSSSSGGSSSNALGRPRLFQSSSSSSNGLGAASRSASLVDGLKRFGSTGRNAAGRNSSGGGGAVIDPEDEKSGLLLDEELVRSDDSPWMSAEDRLSSRLGGLWEEKGKVSNLLSSWKQRLSAQA
jgi:hypothetical protein